MKKGGNNDTKKARMLLRKLQRCFKKQFKFSLVRKFRKRFVSKYIGDEYITIFNPKYNIIVCKHCRKTKRAYLKHSRNCVDCSNSDKFLRKESSFTWDVWGDIIP